MSKGKESPVFRAKLPPVLGAQWETFLKLPSKSELKRAGVWVLNPT